jgi:DnaJ-domain-containing protein 1
MTSYPNHGTKTLSATHQGTLYGDSGIDPVVEAERGTFTASRGKDVPQDHGRLLKKPGIVFPIHTLDGGTFYRLRLNNPGRLPRYMQPKGHPNRLDIHPRQHERIKRPGGMRYVTEGEKKVDAGVSRGLLMVGLSGVWNGQKDKELIPDWSLLPLEGERYSITFDSDIAFNPNVQMAADRQARLLREQGAEVYITLLPPAPDGSKQGLDDFFANGGTARQLELLTTPYEAAVIERVRLTRDQKLRAAIEALWRKWWATEWAGQGGYTDRDLALKVIEAARKHGKVVGNDLRVVKAWGPLMVEAKISSSRTMGKSIARLEDMGFLERDNGGRKADKPGAFVFRSVVRAGVKQYGEKATQAETRRCQDGDDAPGTLHPRAPRLMWSAPKFAPKRGTVSGTRKVRQSKPSNPRPAVARLGKIRGAVVDALYAYGGSCTLAQLCRILHRKRPRDLVRRKKSPKGRDGLLVWLEEAGMLAIEGDRVTLTEGWMDRLEDAREAGGELEAEEVARRRYLDKSRAFHRRHEAPVSKPSAASLEAIRRSRESKAAGLAAIKERVAQAAKAEEQSKAEAFVRDRLRELGRIRLALLQDIARDEGIDAWVIPKAVEVLGCRVEELPEFNNRRFVFAPAEGAA